MSKWKRDLTPMETLFFPAMLVFLTVNVIIHIVQLLSLIIPIFSSIIPRSIDQLVEFNHSYYRAIRIKGDFLTLEDKEGRIIENVPISAVTPVDEIDIMIKELIDKIPSEGNIPDIDEGWLVK